MRRLFVAFGVSIVIAVCVATPTGQAELENQIFTSRPHRLRLVVPRGWRATDQPSYPGLLMWMMRSQPVGKIVLTAEPFTRSLYCSWPVACRTSPDSLPSKLACAMRQKLQAQRMTVGPVQAGPKETEQAGLPSVWFEIDSGKQFLRQAVALGEDQVISLVLSAPSAESRSAHVRAFEQALRTLRPLTLEELGVPTPDPEIVVMQLVAGDAGPQDAGALPDASTGAPGSTFESAPAPKINPVGPCTKQ